MKHCSKEAFNRCQDRDKCGWPAYFADGSECDEFNEQIDKSCWIGSATEGKEMTESKWDLFDLITSTYYGKMMYAMEPSGIVYSRYSSKYMTFDDAIEEFLSLIRY